jgi:hypothetical protein
MSFLENQKIQPVDLNAALKGYIPYLTVTGSDDGGGGTGHCDIQAKDAAGNNLAQRFLIHIWIADAEFSEPDAQTDFAVEVGEQMYEPEPNADYTVIADATGLVRMGIDNEGGVCYVHAQIDGRIYSSGAISITA